VSHWCDNDVFCTAAIILTAGTKWCVSDQCHAVTKVCDTVVTLLLHWCHTDMFYREGAKTFKTVYTRDTRVTTF
jgi:hypothetical protein